MSAAAMCLIRKRAQRIGSALRAGELCGPRSSSVWFAARIRGLRFRLQLPTRPALTRRREQMLLVGNDPVAAALARR